MEPHLATPDPQWGFVLAIRAELDAHGRYSIDVDTRDAQARVDVHWAARQAARLLGAKVQIDTSSPFGHADSIATMTIRCIEGVNSDRRRVEAGLDRLRRSVEATQARDPQRTWSHPAAPAHT